MEIKSLANRYRELEKERGLDIKRQRQKQNLESCEMRDLSHTRDPQ